MSLLFFFFFFFVQLNLKFRTFNCWGFRSSGMWYYIIGSVFYNILKNCSAFNLQNWGVQEEWTTLRLVNPWRWKNWYLSLKCWETLTQQHRMTSRRHEFSTRKPEEISKLALQSLLYMSLPYQDTFCKTFFNISSIKNVISK